MKKCPECNSENIDCDECGDVDCEECGSLFYYCLDCDWDEHTRCPVEIGLWY